MTSLKKYDMKLSTEKGCFIYDFISTLNDVTENDLNSLLATPCS
jgi:hypothetical protein